MKAVDPADPLELIVPPPAPKSRWTIRRLMIAVAVVGICFGILRLFFLIVDSLLDGPYTRVIDRQHQELTDDAHLIGRPEADIVAVLGKPWELWKYQNSLGAEVHTFNHAPSWVGMGLSQVHCRGGIVRALERLDD